MKVLESVINGVKGYYKNTTAQYRGKSTENQLYKAYNADRNNSSIPQNNVLYGKASICSILKIKRMIGKIISKKCLKS